MARTDDPLKILLWVVLAVGGSAVATSLLGGWFWGWNGSMGAGMMGFGSGWMWLMMLVPILLVVVLVYALAGNRNAERAPNDALATADRRYAAGEISREEFLRIKEDLKGGTRP